MSWLRLQASIDTSGARTPEEVKAKAALSGGMKRIRVEREDDIEAAVETFIGWADAQYRMMRREEATLRWWALRMRLVKKGSYKSGRSKGPHGNGEGVDIPRGRLRKRARADNLAERAGF